MCAHLRPDRRETAQHTPESRPITPCQQFGAIPVRAAGDGSPEILLVTRRGGGRWIIPKGWPARGLAPADSAAREAFEEAGVRGTIAGEALGRIVARKRGAAITVGVYVLHVELVLARWPEMDRRARAWFTPDAAAAAVREADLAPLFEQAARTLRTPALP
jgi:8-oxo-dGTP pyrophosphatase MutT (NUDIX family)